MKTKPRILVSVNGGAGESKTLLDWGDLSFLDMVDEWFHQLKDLPLLGDEAIKVEVHLMSDKKFHRLKADELAQAQ